MKMSQLYCGFGTFALLTGFFVSGEEGMEQMALICSLAGVGMIVLGLNTKE